MRRASAAAVLSAVLLAALVLAVAGEALLPGRVLFYRDIGTAVHPVLAEARLAADGGVDILPLWSNHLSNGRPLLANPGNALLHPANVLYLLLPFDDALDAFIVLHVLLAALGMLGLARRIGVSWPAAFAAGAAYGLGGGTLSATNLYPWMPAVAVAPLVLTAALRAVARPTGLRCGWLALALALQALGGQPEPVALTVLVAVALGATRGLASGDPALRLSRLPQLLRSGLVIGVSGAWALLFAAPQLVPGALNASRSIRAFGFTAKGLLFNSVSPARLAWLFVPGLGGDPLTRLEGGFPGAMLLDTGTPYFLTVYVGASVGVLALLALAPAGRSQRFVLPEGRRPHVTSLALVCLLGALLSLGRHLPGVPELVDALPGIVPFRYPEKCLFLVFLTIPLLAAVGLDRLAGALAPPASRPRLAAVLGLALAALVAIDLGLAQRGRLPTLETAALDRPLLLEALDARATALGVASWDWRLHHLREPGPRRPPAGLPSDVTEQSVHRRQLQALSMGKDVRQSFEPTGDLLDLKSYFALAKNLHAGGLAQRLQGLGEAGVLFVLAREPLAGEAGEPLPAVPVLDLARDLGFPPGAGFVYRLTSFRPRASVVPPAAGSARIVAEDHRSLGVRVDCAAPCELVVTDALAPGWRAVVDGEPVPIQLERGAFRRVAVPVGTHDVRFEYSVPGLTAGLLACLLGCVLLLLAVRAAKRAEAGDDGVVRPAAHPSG